MSTSEIEYGGRKLSASDAVLEVWLKLLVDEFDKLEARPEWLTTLRDDWYAQAAAHYGHGIVLQLDEDLSQSSRRDLVRHAAVSALTRLRSLGDPISAQTLNAVGAGRPEAPFTRELPAQNFTEAAEDFIDLLEVDDGAEQSLLDSPNGLVTALTAHATWLADPATGKRLRLRDAELPGADLKGANLTRARLTRVNLRTANLTRAKLFRTELDAVNLEGARLDDAELCKVKIRACNFNRASFEGTSITKSVAEDTCFDSARFDQGTLTGSSFFRVTMRGAVVRNAKLQCILYGDLRDCDFTGSDLRGASFLNADLRNANFESTNLVKAGFKRVRLHAAHGVPFLANKIGGSELDFSSGGDGSMPGTLIRLRELLGGGPGSRSWGTSTLPALYVALSVEGEGGRYFSIERRSDHSEVFRVTRCEVERRRLAIDYQIVDLRFDDDTAQDLISTVLLEGLLARTYRAEVDDVGYRNVGTRATVIRPYQ